MKSFVLTLLVAVLGSASCLAAEDGLVGARQLNTAAASFPDASGHGLVVQVSETLHGKPPLEEASYVPVPRPAKTKYTLWMHYCPLWKEGTHWGWKRIEPWPERKPLLGWYNEGTPEVADWHIKYMLEHGISGVIYCWYRANVGGPVKQRSGHALHDGLLKARYLPMIHFGILWENACGQGVSSADDLLKNVLPFWIDNYFSRPSYIRVNGKPVVYILDPRVLTKQLGGNENVRKAFQQMRAECKRRGLGGLYVVGCANHRILAILADMRKEGYDASSSYGNNTYPIPDKVTRVGEFTCAPYEGFTDYQESLWKFKRRFHLMPDITTIMMGWDSRPWKETPFFWSDNTPEKFRNLCHRAKTMMDASTGSGPDKRTAVFCSWNEFGEGHYIEPTHGYGFSYLDVIRDVFCEGPCEHVDLVPQDVGLKIIDSWYRDSKKKAVASPVSAVAPAASR